MMMMMMMMIIIIIMVIINIIIIIIIIMTIIIIIVSRAKEIRYEIKINGYSRFLCKFYSICFQLCLRRMTSKFQFSMWNCKF